MAGGNGREHAEQPGTRNQSAPGRRSPGGRAGPRALAQRRYRLEPRQIKHLPKGVTSRRASVTSAAPPLKYRSQPEPGRVRQKRGNRPIGIAMSLAAARRISFRSSGLTPMAGLTIYAARPSDHMNCMTTAHLARRNAPLIDRTTLPSRSGIPAMPALRADDQGQAAVARGRALPSLHRAEPGRGRAFGIEGQTSPVMSGRSGRVLVARPPARPEVLEDEEPDGFVAEPTEAEPACKLSLLS
jgi:hypothetical protein